MILEFNDTPEGLVVDIEVVAGGLQGALQYEGWVCLGIVGLGKISPAAAPYERQLADLRLQLISGNEGPANRKGR